MIHLSVTDEEDAPRAACRLERVRDHQQCLPGQVDLLEDIQQRVRCAGIKRAGRFVRQNQAWMRNQRPTHGGALLLPAGDFVGVLFQQVRNPQLIGNRQQIRLHLAPVHALQHQRQENIVLERKGVQQVEVLKHEPQLITPERRQLIFTNRADVLAVQQHRAARRAVKRRQYVQQRRFARPRFAHNRDILALIHREGHIRQRLHLIAPEPRRIHLANILCFQQCHDSSSSKAALFPRVNFLLTRLFYHAPDRPAIESGDILPALCDISVR